jgi:hypothetical protein
MSDYSERNLTIQRLAGEGVSRSEISRRFGITRQRVGQIVKHWRPDYLDLDRWLVDPDDDRIVRLEALCAELYQVLGNLGAPKSVLDQALAAAEGRDLSRRSLLPFTKMSESQKMSGFCDWKTIDPDVDKPTRERQKRLARLLEPSILDEIVKKGETDKT